MRGNQQQRGLPVPDDGRGRGRSGVPRVFPEYSPSQEAFLPDSFNTAGGAPPSAAKTGGGLLSGLTRNFTGAMGNTTPAQPPTGPGTGTSANPVTSKLPGVFSETPNLMQKFSELTHSAIGGGGEASGDSLLSKGKDLIFKRFGL